MGTRHLVAVVVDGVFKVAQYGQWDGYPSGQGKTVLDFLQNHMRPDFIDKARAASWITDEELDRLWTEAGAVNGTISWEKSEAFGKRHPELSRDTGAKILHLVQDREPGIQLQDMSSFACDSLFCEFAYVLDLDKAQLEVYRGFNQKPVPAGERFAHLPASDPKHETYYPIRLAGSWSFSALPTLKQMEEACGIEETT